MINTSKILLGTSLVLMAQLLEANNSVDEILVTARARPEAVSDVPISLAVVSGEVIDKFQIDNLETLSGAVPNFTVSQDPIGDKINIRGIFTGELASLEQSISTFVDGVNHGRGAQARFSFLDLERVEVLRGPQSTLFGKNTVGGALSLTTRKPTESFEAQIKLGFEPVLDESLAAVTFSGPVNDVLRARFAAQSTDQNKGWVDNKFYDDSGPQQQNDAARLSVDWDVAEETLLRFRLERGLFDQTGQPFSLIEAGALGPLLSNQFDIDSDDFDKSANGQVSTSELDFGSNGVRSGNYDEYALTLIREVDLGSVEVLLARSEFEFKRQCDCDFGPLTLLGFNDSEDFSQTSLSLRLVTDPGKKLQSVFGLYYQKSSSEVTGLTSLETPTANALSSAVCSLSATDEVSLFATLGNFLAGVPLDASGATLINSVATAAELNTCITAGATSVFNAPISRVSGIDQKASTLAAYVSSEYQLNSQWSFGFGLRYTTEKKNTEQFVYRSVFNSLEQTSVVPGDLDLLILLEAATHRFDDSLLERSEADVSFSLVSEYAFNEAVNTYLSIATGFKAGGFNIAAFSADPSDAEFEEEGVETIELGLKVLLNDGSSSFNAAVFHTIIDDLQTTQFTGSTSFIVQNAAKAQIVGIELDGRHRFNQNWSANASLAYTDFEFKSFPNAACTEAQLVANRQAIFATGSVLAPSDPVAAATLRLTGAASNLQQCSQAGVNDLSGRTSEQVPEFTAQFGIEYQQTWNSGLEFRLTTNTVWYDEQFRQQDLDPVAKSDSFAKTDVNVTFAKASWELALIGRNVFDENTFSFVNDTPLSSGTHHQIVDKPRQLFLQLTYSF